MADVAVRGHFSLIYPEHESKKKEDDGSDEQSDIALSSDSEGGSPSQIKDWNYDDQASQFFIIRRNKEKTWFASQVDVLQLPAEDLERMYELIDEDRHVSNYYKSLAMMLRRIHNNATQLVAQEVIDVQPLDQYNPITAWSYDHLTGLYTVDRAGSALQRYEEVQLFGFSRSELQELASIPLNNPSRSMLGAITEATIKYLASQQ